VSKLAITNYQSDLEKSFILLKGFISEYFSGFGVVPGLISFGVNASVLFCLNEAWLDCKFWVFLGFIQESKKEVTLVKKLVAVLKCCPKKYHGTRNYRIFWAKECFLA